MIILVGKVRRPESPRGKRGHLDGMVGLAGGGLKEVIWREWYMLRRGGSAGGGIGKGAQDGWYRTAAILENWSINDIKYSGGAVDIRK